MKDIKDNNIDYWNKLAGLDVDAAVIDPNDTKGYKNKYIIYIRNIYLNKFLSSIKANSRVLDFGSGTGNATRYITKYSHKCVGIDVAEELVDVAHSISKENTYVVYDGRTLPFSNGAFDAVFTYVVLTYITNDEDLVNTLTQINKVVKKGSKLLLIEQTAKHEKILEGGLKKIRTSDEYHNIFIKSGFNCKEKMNIRSSRFPFIYLVRYGLIKEPFFKYLSKIEKYFYIFSSCFPNEYNETAFYLET